MSKSRQYQRQLTLAKQYAKNRKRKADSRVTEGVTVHHAYEEPYKTHSWWDDFGFHLGSQYVMVWWIHPRMQLRNRASDAAYDHTIATVGNYNSNDFLENSSPIYKKVGKGKRKKIVGYRTTLQDAPEEGLSFAEFHKHWNRRIHEMLTNGEAVAIKPSISVKQLNWCRGVDLCFPVELRNETDIIAFAHRVKQHLKGEINIFEGLEGYQYTPQMYCQELPAELEQLIPKN